EIKLRLINALLYFLIISCRPIKPNRCSHCEQRNCAKQDNQYNYAISNNCAVMLHFSLSPRAHLNHPITSAGKPKAVAYAAAVPPGMSGGLVNTLYEIHVTRHITHTADSKVNVLTRVE